jgi:hypothetical protein
MFDSKGLLKFVEPILLPKYLLYLSPLLISSYENSQLIKSSNKKEYILFKNNSDNKFSDRFLEIYTNSMNNVDILSSLTMLMQKIKNSDLEK